MNVCRSFCIAASCDVNTSNDDGGGGDLGSTSMALSAGILARSTAGYCGAIPE